MGRKANKRKRDATRHELMQRFAEASRRASVQPIERLENAAKVAPEQTAPLKVIEEDAMHYSINIGEVTKTIDGVSHPAGDFLSVPDEEKPSTWSLPVKKNGTPDRRLAGAAWAALFSPGGFRGQKYQGDDKSEAQRKLKALYKSEDWPLPGGTEEAAVGESYSGEAPMYIPFGVTSFAGLKAAVSAKQAVDEIREYASLLPMLVDNILADAAIEDKKAQVQTLAAEFVDMVGAAIGAMPAQSQPDNDSDETNDVETSEDGGEAVAYISTSDLAEADAARYAALVEGDKPTHAYVDIVAIQPGWGNKRDNHYYPVDVLASEDTRKAFAGAKMYESEHKEADKNNRTWVSTVVEAVGVHKTGAPIYRVAIHDPYFAEKVHNLNTLGLLDKLECSIQGEGQAVDGYSEGARKGKRLEKFISISNIDWVTKAGAGGHAVALVGENDKGANMEEQKTGNPTEQENTEQVAEAVKVNEQQPQTEAPTAEAPVAETVVASDPVPLAETAVVALLEASKLPSVSKTRLAKVTYASEEEVKTAIQAEIDYLKEATGSGKPVGGAGRQADPAQALSEASAKKDEINNRFLGLSGK